MPTVVLPILHRGQLRLARGLKRFNMARMGRRWGKTVFGVDYLLDEQSGIPGALRGTPVAWFAPTYKLLQEPWEQLKTILRPVTMSRRDDLHTITLTTGGRVDAWTMDGEDPGRSRHYAKVVIDEAAMVRSLRRKWEEAIRPTLTDLRGGALFTSTPKGRNDFHTLHTMNASSPEWAFFHAPSVDNPYLDPAEIEHARENLPERIFKQEYEAEFMDTGGGVFRRVMDAVDFDHDGAPLEHILEGSGVVIGVDWGRHEDFTVLIALDGRHSKVLAVDRFSRIDYAIQKTRLKAMHSRYPKSVILAELNSMGGPLVESLQREGWPIRGFQTTAASKAEAIEALALAFEKDELTIPNHPHLVAELLAFDQERLPSGMIRYGAPQGEHDDCVIALAIAWHGALLKMGGTTVASAGERVF